MIAKIRKRIYQSLLISLLVHVGFLVWSFFVKFLDVPIAEKPSRVIHVKLTKENPGQEAPRGKVNESPKSLQPENTMSQPQQWQPPTPPREAVKENVAAAVEKTGETMISSSAKAPQVAQPQIKGLESQTGKMRKAVRKNLVEVGEVPKADFFSGVPELDSGEELAKDFLDRSNPAVEVLPVAPAKAGSGQSEFQLMQKYAAGLNKRLRTADLGTTLTYELFKYKDPKTGEKYFKLLVKVRDAMVNFPVIPKELVFLVDSSASIGTIRLNQFEEGVAYSLSHLNPTDRFNVVVFKNKTIPFSPVSLEATEDNIQKAINFVKGLNSGSTTDVYNALRSSMNTKEPFTPSYRLMLSDGFPTRGIVDARQVINEISDANNGKVGIFTFAGGVSISRYMMEFVGFKNRGWARFEDRDHLIAQSVSQLYDQIKDPLLLDLHYHISGVDDQEVFPRDVPDFFKGSEFVIYGKYDKDDKVFLQVLGDALEGKKEFIVGANLKEAQIGTKEIAKTWAFHKVYYLISRLKYKENNSDLSRQIDELCSKFGVVTPYSKIFRDEIKPVQAPKPQAAAPSAAPKSKQNFGPKAPPKK